MSETHRLKRLQLLYEFFFKSNFNQEIESVIKNFYLDHYIKYFLPLNVSTS